MKRRKTTVPKRGARRKKAAKSAAARRTRKSRSKATRTKSGAGEIRRRKAPARKRAAAPRRRAARRAKPSRASTERPQARPDEFWRRGMGAEAAGQSGDTEDISRSEIADSESVEELLEEGQSFEAGIVSGVENAPAADEAEVRTREVPEDDVPREYLDED